MIGDVAGFNTGKGGVMGDRLQNLAKAEDLDREQISIEMRQCKDRLVELRRLASMNDTPFRKETPRITFNVSAGEYDMIHQLAFRCGVSVSEMGKLAMLRLVTEAENGTVPILPESERPKGNA